MKKPACEPENRSCIRISHLIKSTLINRNLKIIDGKLKMPKWELYKKYIYLMCKKIKQSF